MDDTIFYEPYKCYCSCDECREWEAKTGQKPDCELISEEIYSQLGLGPGIYNTTTATGIEARETYNRLFGRYPEEVF